MKNLIKFFIFSVFLLSFSSVCIAQSNYDNASTHPCLRCHSSQAFTFYNTILEKDQKRLMNPYYVIDSTALKNGSHKNFDCIDCHSADYANYPHIATLKLEAGAGCIDCHGGDPTFESYKFDQINEEFQKSSHFMKFGDDFTCSKCHNIHTYKPIARNDSTINDIVKHSNSMCLSCHDENRNNALSDKSQLKINQIHEWLPNQQLHFEHVRCIECHAVVSDSILVSHNIRTKAEAIKNCTECHNSNSRLKSTLYKYTNLQKRSEDGSVRSVIANDSYVIGSQQYPMLTNLSYLILALTLFAIIVHSIFRILKK